MPSRIIIIFFLFFYMDATALAQSDRRIWLGEDILTKFESGPMIRDSSDRFVSMFLLYHVSRLEFSPDTAIETTNRDGLVLKARSITSTRIGGEAVVNNSDDSCHVEFNTIIERVRHGRSATLSLLNLFSGKGDTPQEEPYHTNNHVSSSGTILFHTEKTVFIYTINYSKDRIKPAGWLVLHGDTLYIKPVTAQVKLPKGKIKKPDYTSPAGLLLLKGGSVVAAIDQETSPLTAYIARYLSEADKLVIAAFLLSLPLNPNRLLWL
jgi:hypothetical protein